MKFMDGWSIVRELCYDGWESNFDGRVVICAYNSYWKSSNKCLVTWYMPLPTIPFSIIICSEYSFLIPSPPFWTDENNRLDTISEAVSYDEFTSDWLNCSVSTVYFFNDILDIWCLLYQNSTLPPVYIDTFCIDPAGGFLFLGWLLYMEFYYWTHFFFLLVGGFFSIKQQLQVYVVWRLYRGFLKYDHN